MFDSDLPTDAEVIALLACADTKEESPRNARFDD
jgi:hypothetical protein